MEAPKATKKVSSKKKSAAKDGKSKKSKEPDWQPYVRVWAIEKPNPDDGQAKKKKKDYEAPIGSVPCSNEKCKKKKIKAGEAVFSHSMKDMNAKSTTHDTSSERDECIRCAMPGLLSSGTDISSLPGWAEMSEKVQSECKKLFWKEKARVAKREKTKAEIQHHESEIESKVEHANEANADQVTQKIAQLSL